MPLSKPTAPFASETGDPFLLTPGPLTTSRSVKAAMLHDWGSRDANFIAINKAVLARLCEIANGEGRLRDACRCRAPAPSPSRRC